MAVALISFHNCSLDAKIKMNLGIFLFFSCRFVRELYSVCVRCRFDAFVVCIAVLVDCLLFTQRLRLWKWLMRLRRSQQQRSNFPKLIRVLVFCFIM